MQIPRQDRAIRVFAFDPHVARQFRYARSHEVTIVIPHRMESLYGRPDVRLKPGPVGEYLEVVDYDPASSLFYSPIDLDDWQSSRGLTPEESDPQFHQQMVYAVAMRTISAFESALGRVALWSPHHPKKLSNGVYDDIYVGKLRLYPHALREANAYYNPSKKAILFGYFRAEENIAGVPSGGTVFTCLSHDIIAHEVSHALLDGMHSRFVEASNPDVLALHEAVADIVALFQHFSYPEVLIDQISRTRGNLEAENLMGQLAQEFGKAIGRRSSLRDALGKMGDDGVWRRRQPDRALLAAARGPHARGAILVAAVFDFFIAIYRSRTDDLYRIATGGSGILPPGAILPDLAARLAEEAAKCADLVLRLCIRALDYCPPVDVRFGDYLRAIITADHDLFPEDERHYRVAIIESFIAWGIQPEGMSTVTSKTLLWPSLDDIVRDAGNVAAEMRDGAGLTASFGTLIENPSAMLEWIRRSGKIPQSTEKRLNRIAGQIGELLRDRELKRAEQRRDPDGKLTAASRDSAQSKFSAQFILSQNLLLLGLEADREIEWWVQKLYALVFWAFLTAPQHRMLTRSLGLVLDDIAPPTIYRSTDPGLEFLPTLDVQSVRMARRRGEREQMEAEYVVEVVQRRRGYFDPEVQKTKDSKPGIAKSDKGDFTFRRGCTLLIDARSFAIRRVIRTRGDLVDSRELDRVRNFLSTRRALPLNALDGGYQGDDPLHDTDFAHLHRMTE